MAWWRLALERQDTLARVGEASCPFRCHFPLPHPRCAAKFIHWNYPQIREYLKHLKNQNCLKTSQIKATFSFANGTNINTPTILTRQNKPRRKPGLLSYQMTLATHKNMRKMSLSCKTPSDETFWSIPSKQTNWDMSLSSEDIWIETCKFEWDCSKHSESFTTWKWD